MTHRSADTSNLVSNPVANAEPVSQLETFEETARVLRRLARIEAAPNVAVIETRGQRQLNELHLQQLVEVERVAARAKRSVIWARLAAGLSLAATVAGVAATGIALQPELLENAGAEIADAFALNDTSFASTSSAEMNPGRDEPEEVRTPSIPKRPNRIVQPKPKASADPVSDWLSTDCSADPYDPLNGCLL